jgi:hypothetical protein
MVDGDCRIRERNPASSDVGHDSSIGEDKANPPPSQRAVCPHRSADRCWRQAVSGPHEPRIVADPFRGGFRVIIKGPEGFERTVTFALDDDPAVIAERVRETVEE